MHNNVFPYLNSLYAHSKEIVSFKYYSPFKVNIVKLNSDIHCSGCIKVGCVNYSTYLETELILICCNNIDICICLFNFIICIYTRTGYIKVPVYKYVFNVDWRACFTAQLCCKIYCNK